MYENIDWIIVSPNLTAFYVFKLTVKSRCHSLALKTRVLLTPLNAEVNVSSCMHTLVNSVSPPKKKQNTMVFFFFFQIAYTSNYD